MRVYQVVVVVVALMCSPVLILAGCLPAKRPVTIPKVEPVPLDQRSKMDLGEVQFLNPGGADPENLYVCGFQGMRLDGGFSCIEYKDFLDALKSQEDEIKSKYPEQHEAERPAEPPSGYAL